MWCFIFFFYRNDSGIMLGYEWIYPLGMTVTVCHGTYWTWLSRDDVSFPSYKRVIFHSFLSTVYQRVSNHFPLVFWWFSYVFPIDSYTGRSTTRFTNVIQWAYSVHDTTMEKNWVFSPGLIGPSFFETCLAHRLPMSMIPALCKWALQDGCVWTCLVARKNSQFD